MILLDTDVLIDLLRAQPTTMAWFEKTFASEEPPAISVITKLEILKGSRSASERTLLTSWLKRFALIHVSELASQKADTLYTRYQPRQGIGILDALIAATAITHSAVLYTGNLRHFRGIVGLKLKTYR